ncbi:MAG: DUF1552 domain-containing protein [Vicinamibacterales bacterium]|nr:DUF1552 domain-containing protein [Vicinamibacterales bacterium]
MIVTKKALPRRTVLRGIGATIALPFLDAMAPALTATVRTAANPIPRLGFVYAPNGMFLPNFHPAGGGGRGFEMSPILKPLEPYRDQLVVVSGLSNRGLVSTNEGGGVHTRAHGGWLSGVLPKRTEGADIEAGKTIDQYAADTLGADTSLRSLELTTESNFTVGNCENGYSCTYQNSTSWRTATTPLPHERDPRVVFQRLFGDGGSMEARLAQMKTDRSILDSVTESIDRLERRLGLRDRSSVEEYLDAVREIERRIQRAEQGNAATPLPAVEQPGGVPEEYDEHVLLLFDMLVLAYQADVTRVSCTQMARELSGRTYPNIGVPEAHHSVSHHQLDPHNIEQYTKINTHQMSLFAQMVEKMHNTPDGDGTLLEHTILLYGTGMGDGDHHTPYNLPVTLVGGGNGQLVGGRHLQYELDTPFMNLGVSLLDKVGARVDHVSDSTGRLADL